MAPKRGEALSSMKRIYLDAGRSDEWYLDLGAQAFSKELEKLGVEHTLELFEGTHMGIQYRYPGAIAALAEALSG
jgi:dienelactone hydrolase